MMDPDAEFRRLYDAHRGAVHAYFAGRTGDPQAAADLMQEVFLRAWRHQGTLAGLSPDGERAWLFTVARNLSVDTVRQRRTQAETGRALAREPAPAAGPPASTAVLAAERAAVVAAAIAALPESQRVTLALAAAAEMTSAEIGTALGVPAGTVRYRLSLARRAVADALRRYDHDVEGAVEGS
jgi:RNA polymerase sigma-70 factor (ECF subfamily)